MMPSLRSPLYAGADIERLIPQRAPIVMLDAYYGIEDGVSHSGLRIEASNLLVEHGALSEAGLIEHVAQSAAARLGYIALEQSAPIRLGFIGSVDKLSIERLPLVGEELHTAIVVEQEVFGITLIRAEVRVEQELIASTGMKIVLQDEEKSEATA